MTLEMLGADFVGGGGGGHHGHHGGGGGFRYPGVMPVYPWWATGPFAQEVVEIEDEVTQADLDAATDSVADELAERVAEKLKTKVRGDLEMLGADVGDPAFVSAAVKDFEAQLGATPVTFEVARRVAARALAMTDEAEKAAKANASSLVGPAMWELPRGHLRWHADAVAKELAGRDPNATPYERAADLKKWAAAAYRTLMTTVQSDAITERIRTELWSDLASAVAAIPASAVEQIRKIPGAIVEGATGLPLWAWTLIVVGGVGLVGFAAYKVLLAAAPSAGAALAGRLGR